MKNKLLKEVTDLKNQLDKKRPLPSNLVKDLGKIFANHYWKGGKI